MDRNTIPHDPCHLGVPSGASKTISEPVVRSVQTVHQSCVKISTISKWTKVEPRHKGVPLGSSKTISKPKVRVAQTVHLSCIQTDRNEIPHETRHVGVPSGASKTISEPMVHLVQTVHLFCIKISTISKKTEMSFLLSPVT
jgi:hypothetical protein